MCLVPDALVNMFLQTSTVLPMADLHILSHFHGKVENPTWLASVIAKHLNLCEQKTLLLKYLKHTLNMIRYVRVTRYRGLACDILLLFQMIIPREKMLSLSLRTSPRGNLQ